MRTHSFIIACLALVLYSCGGELAPLDPEEECIKTWTVEINNPEASVSIENGILIVDIQNPKTPQDVRLIQLQDENSLIGEVGIGITVNALETVPQRSTTSDAHIKASFAYQQNPDQLFLSKVYGQYGSRGYSMGKEVYRNYSTDYFAFYASGTEAKFNTSRGSTPYAEIPLVSSAQKLCYLDFGINPSFSNGEPTQSIHAEIDIVAFGDYTEEGVKLVSGYNRVQYGFRVDTFFCNTLK
ncbi:hypothetical protein GCM10027429_00980 [Marivirga atlantica]|uniref:Lipoprotein n=1 Tax=Marivirga atlantica TaxID=1548457 RepID=A0A937A7Q1_9BACT|nr:hypothetical protein [Marivirga atlantica]MBL0763710.1 hypothetical protein [Marivirga atlantica]